MLVLDASSAVHAWDNYPFDQFPPLWAWLARQIAKGELTISAVALGEVGGVAPECAAWLKAQRIKILPMTQEILMDALRIKALLGIEGEMYGGGVGENDLFIIAGAWAYKAELLTDEARQPSLPNSKRSYKMPAVCGLPDVQIICLSFVEYLKRSQEVFA